MLLIKINGTDYEVCSDWKDLTIRKVCEVYAIPLPEKLAEIYQVIYRTKLPYEEKEKVIEEITGKLTDKEQHKTFPMFYASVLKCLSNISEELISKTDVVSIKTIYFQFLQKFVEGIRYFPVYDYHPINWFEYKGVTYWLPKSRNVFGVNVPMAEITAMEFIESADFLTAVSGVQRDLSKLATIVAILCRPEGEKYSDTKTIERTELFQELTMDVVWNVFFSLAMPLIILGQCTATSLNQKERAR